MLHNSNIKYSPYQYNMVRDHKFCIYKFIHKKHMALSTLTVEWQFVIYLLCAIKLEKRKSKPPFQEFCLVSASLAALVLGNINVWELFVRKKGDERPASNITIAAVLLHARC